MSCKYLHTSALIFVMKAVLFFSVTGRPIFPLFQLRVVGAHTKRGKSGASRHACLVLWLRGRGGRTLAFDGVFKASRSRCIAPGPQCKKMHCRRCLSLYSHQMFLWPLSCCNGTHTWDIAKGFTLITVCLEVLKGHPNTSKSLTNYFFVMRVLRYQQTNHLNDEH